jgi:uncharacterized protein YegP (UPF0339 family)
MFFLPNRRNMTNPKFELFKDTKGEYRFNLRAKNGEIILRSSEGYVTKQGCQQGIASVKLNAPYDSRYDRRTATNGQYYFVLKAGNGEPLGISEMYITVSGRDNGIEAVKRDAPNAPIEDQSATESVYRRYW